MLRVGFYCSGRERCTTFAQQFAQGVHKYGDICSIHPVLPPQGEPDPEDYVVKPNVDVAVINSVQHKKTFATMREAGIPIVYIDKAYNRSWAYRRVSVGALQPTRYLGELGADDDRRRMFDWHPRPWRRSGQHILLAWSSEHYHGWYGWVPPEEHAQQIVDILRKYTTRPLIYRCKPNRGPSRALQYAFMSMPGTLLEYELKNCHALVTPGTSTCLTALLNGIPTIVLADALVKNISSTMLAEVEQPRLASESERLALLNDLAYCQWSVAEFASGLAWEHIRTIVRWLRHTKISGDLVEIGVGGEHDGV